MNCGDITGIIEEMNLGIVGAGTSDTSTSDFALDFVELSWITST